MKKKETNFFSHFISMFTTVHHHVALNCLYCISEERHKEQGEQASCGYAGSGVVGVVLVSETRRLTDGIKKELKSGLVRLVKHMARIIWGISYTMASDRKR